MTQNEIRDVFYKGGYTNIAELFIYATACNIAHFEITTEIDGVLSDKHVVVPESFEEFARIIKEDDLDDCSIEFFRDFNEGCMCWLNDLRLLHEKRRNTEKQN